MFAKMKMQYFTDSLDDFLDTENTTGSDTYVLHYSGHGEEERGQKKLLVSV
jgi:hypothetical protein